MKKIIGLFTLLFAMTSFAVAQNSFEGVWKTIDDETGDAKAHVKIYQKNGEYFAKVIKILNPDRLDAVCDKCKKSDPRRGKPILNMVIMSGMKKVRNDALKGGKILKANNGKEYRCEMYLQEDPNHLVVKGYVGPIGKRQNWYRVE